MTKNSRDKSLIELVMSYVRHPERYTEEEMVEEITSDPMFIDAQGKTLESVATEEGLG